MHDELTMSFEEIVALGEKALLASKVSPKNAKSVAQSIAAAERDGQKIVGLSYLPVYCDHAACGKVDGFAEPKLEQRTPSLIAVDAGTGFAHPAIALGLPALAEAAKAQGIAALAVGNSYACGSLGYFVEELADQGLVAFMVANASPSIAPFGGKTPFFGTNPIAFAAPRKDRAAFVMDQSSSVVAKVAVIDAQTRGIPLPDGWAIDKDGKPTNDANAAMDGSLLPIGGYKGFGLALMVDILAAGLTGSHWSFEASSFGDCEGGPPRTGQFIIALSPEKFAGPSFADRLEVMLSAVLETPDVRLPGDRRLSQRDSHKTGIVVSKAAVEVLQAKAAG
ncbi:Ldh family oxidoreductase [Rhizobium sp. KVB221]|uniref:Ldh family oxidoreductase n=1 Tax=Rhizobium setariae TaxID=2801340 RepID=A0A937CM09_9HYPH|nr:Ldh family oxidoreductase [Rhizobium setariae]MBL0373760.1 Ldh family oxidoreductase [Rhizobium setariae]